MMAASPSRAAESVSASSAPVAAAQTPVRKAQIVRADPKTGKLVRQIVIMPRTVASPAAKSQLSDSSSTDLHQMVEDAAKSRGVDPLLIHSIIKVESNYNPNAVSVKGAEGLMQLMPGTARMLGVNNSFDPRENIEAGVKYLKQLQDLYKDDRLALAAYNAGPGAVDKYKQVPPYKETENYVYQVGKRYGEARRAADAVNANKSAKPDQANAAAPAIQTQPEEKPPKLEQFVDENGRLHLRTIR